MELIQSKENSLIKSVKKLKEKKHRVEKNQFLVEGFRFVSEALLSNFMVKLIFVSENSISKYEEFNIKDKLQQDATVFKVTESILRQLSATETPQGIVAVVESKKVELNGDTGFYVLVDKVQDPGNLGTIIRTAHASGSLGIIATKGTVDIYNEKTLRASMGSVFHIPIIEDDNLEKLEALMEKGFKLVVSSLDTNQNFFDVNLKENVIIALGNEGSGISEEIFSRSSIKVKIPMPGNAESLNVSTAAAVMMFEIVRQNMI